MPGLSGTSGQVCYWTLLVLVWSKLKRLSLPTQPAIEINMKSLCF